MTGHEHWDEQAAGYALDALEPDELAEFDGHLAGFKIIEPPAKHDAPGHVQAGVARLGRFFGACWSVSM